MKILNTFFAEKDLAFADWTIEHNGNSHFIDSDFIVDVILNKTPLLEQKKIWEILRMIDFRDGSVNHFLEYLANAYVKTNY